MEKLRHIGGSAQRIDALEKVTGRAKYTGDFFSSSVLHGKILRSPHSHARVLSIDTSKAEAVGGVFAVVTAKDMPKRTIAPFLADQFIFADGLVRCIGEPVAAVAATTVQAAEQALGLISVEYEPLPAVFDVLEAFREDAPVVVHAELAQYRQVSRLPIRRDPARPNVCQTFKIATGDLEAGFAEADLVIENRYTTARMQHASIEPHISMAWVEGDGSVVIRSTTQMPREIKKMIEEAFELSPAKVRILTPYVGGGFGGKGGLRLEAVALLLAMESGRPVEVSLTREEMFVFGGHRIGFTVDVRDGVKKDGRLVARDMRLVLDLGAYTDMGPLEVRRSAYGAVGTYRVPNFRLDAYGVYTNLPLTAALRGFGCPEVEWAVEQQMDVIAEAVGLDSAHVRRINLLRDGERDVSGMVTASMAAEPCMDLAAEWIGWGTASKQQPGPWRRGKGMAVGNKSVSNGLPSAVWVKVWEDGTVEVRHGIVEMGQGTSTVLAQIAAEEFGLGLEHVRVVGGDTAFCPFDYGTVASRAVVHSGHALREACRDAKEQLFRRAAEKLDAAMEDLRLEDGTVFVSWQPGRSVEMSELFTPTGLPIGGTEILGRGMFLDVAQPEDPETGQSDNPLLGYAHAASVVEAAVNVETGEVRVLRHGMAVDAGRVMNRPALEGQIHGGISMGIGSAVYEQILFDDGAVANASFTDYHIPSALDVPAGEDLHAMVVEKPDPKGPYGAKGIGELTLVTPAPAIANAVYDAVGVRIYDLPITKERVLAGLTKRRT
ncbi:MAG: xanthine dehydrogenase family protein molybdopterin-binding subunit [Actinobacteria bacterium]|nr:xanthine dehydrogenase family protein molybdopterin-binding subunit [Actinomycetota bacterium]